MKKLIIFLVVAVLVGCNCLGQLPVQILPAGDSCKAYLPDYRDQVTVRDNCNVNSIVQVPTPGTVMDAGNSYVSVIIAATDDAGNVSAINFDVVLLDTTPPVITPDSSLLTYTPEERSGLIAAYHNSIGNEFAQACISGGDSLFNKCNGWRDNPWCDSTFYKESMMTISFPGYNSGGYSTFFMPDLYPVPLDTGQMTTLGYTHLATLYFGEPMSTPVSINSGGDEDDYYEMIEGGTYTNMDLPMTMYRSERYGNFGYRFPTGNGSFEVELHFAEIYWDEPGVRIFDVVMECDTVLTNLDILSEVGFGEPLVKTFWIEVEGGYLDIDFIAVEDYAKISGIVIKSLNGVISQL